jgi:hypothetical protein
MKLSDFVRLADNGLGFDTVQNVPDLEGPRPTPTSPHFRSKENKEHGNWTLVQEVGNQSLVVDRDQNYIIITKTGDNWYEGTENDLGPVGLEQALKEFDPTA